MHGGDRRRTLARSAGRLGGLGFRELRYDYLRCIELPAASPAREPPRTRHELRSPLAGDRPSARDACHRVALTLSKHPCVHREHRARDRSATEVRRHGLPEGSMSEMAVPLPGRLMGQLVACGLAKDRDIVDVTADPYLYLTAAAVHRERPELGRCPRQAYRALAQAGHDAARARLLLSQHGEDLGWCHAGRIAGRTDIPTLRGCQICAS